MVPDVHFRLSPMITRSRRETVAFRHPANIAGLERELMPGDYEVVIEEELIEGLSFASYRRLATLIFVPGGSQHHRSTELVAITSAALAEAQQRDAATGQGIAAIASHE